MQLFYCSSGFINNEAVLDAEESHHCIRVLRYKPGNIIEVVDGQGRYAEAEIISDDAKNCRLSILKLIEDFDHRPYHLHIAIAPTKNNDRSEWFVEKVIGPAGKAHFQQIQVVLILTWLFAELPPPASTHHSRPTLPTNLYDNYYPSPTEYRVCDWGWW